MSEAKVKKLDGVVLLASEGFEDRMIYSSPGAIQSYGRLFHFSSADELPIWFQDLWLDVYEIEFQSIKEATQALKKLGLRWVCFYQDHGSRARLIAEQLKNIEPQRLRFMEPISAKKFHCFSLVDRNKIWAAVQPQSVQPLGLYDFAENKSIPPNRAYLKLWELFSRLPQKPQKGDLCLDLGSSPGGWTWVLQSMGAEVVSVDKAPLAPQIAKLKMIHFLKQSAFALDPEEIGPVDWLFSDIICYPEKLLKLVKKWIETGFVNNFVCTIKFQGIPREEDWRPFLEVRSSQIIKLYQNKNEVTWVSLEKAKSLHI